MGSSGGEVGGAASLAGSRCDIVSLGPACTSAAIVTGILNGDKAYLVSRAVTPAKLSVLDRTTGRIRSTPLPGSQGAWASATIGDDTYVACYLPAVIYRVGADGSSSCVAAPESLQLFFAMAATPDGQLAAGGYPDGTLYLIDPVTGTVSDWGPAIAGEQYIRAVAADATTIYTGVGSHAHLVAYDRTSRARTDILPVELRADSFVDALATSAKYLIAGLHPSGRLAIIEKKNPADFRILTPVPGAIGGIDALAVGGTPDRPVVYGTARPHGVLFCVDLTTGCCTQLGTPMPGQETRGLFIEGTDIEDTNIVGFAGSGGMWTYHLNTGSTDLLDLRGAGLSTGPELPWSLAANDSAVLVGGHFGLQVHHLDTGRTSRIPVDGEPKAQVLSGDTAYLAVYPSGSLLSVDIRTGAVRTLTTFGHAQIRPRDMTRTDHEILIGTQPEYGKLAGALVIYHQHAGTTQVYRNVVSQQSIASVATDGRTAYLGSEIAGGIGAIPTEKQAVVSFFDLATRQVTKTVVPVVGASQIADLVVVGAQLVGVTESGVLFELDRRTGAVRRTLTVSTVGGTVQIADGWMTFTDGDRVLRIDASSWQVTILATGLAGFPLGDMDERHTSLFTTRGTELIRIDLAHSSTDIG